MKIKDVEIKVGITKANIRYYEKEGLISPRRNDENNYRDYSEKDVELLERIKVLRMLGIPIADIKLLNEGSVAFGEVLSRRLGTLRDEEKNLESVKRVCENLLQNSLPYNDVTEKVLEENTGTWSSRLKQIIEEDITREVLSPKQFNTNLVILLIWGYFICAAVSVLWGNWLLDHSGFIPILLGIVCYAAIYFTADVRILFVLFHVTVLNLVPETAFVFRAAPTLIASNKEYDIACRNTCRVMDDSGDRVSDLLFICGYELVSLFSQGLPGTQPLLCNNRRMPYDESFGCGI